MTTQTASLASLIDHILDTHHQYMKRELPRLEGLLQQGLEIHGRALAPMAAVFGPMKDELDGHLMKEERILFPMIRALEGGAAAGTFHCGSVQNPIRVMFLEHDSATEAMASLREMTNGFAPPADAGEAVRALYAGLAGMEADLKEHIRLENEVLFPRAVELEG